MLNKGSGKETQEESEGFFFLGESRHEFLDVKGKAFIKKSTKNRTF